jgi:hypothetical protein
MSYELHREMVEEEYFRSEADAALEEEADRIDDLFNEGEADGLLQAVPKHPESWVYWQGYCLGLRRFWYGKLNIVPEGEF